MYKSYVAVAPHPEDFPRLLDRMGDAHAHSPTTGRRTSRSSAMPVMLVYGDSDMFRPEHIVEFYHLLGGGLKDAGWMRENMSQNRLAILPDLTHYEMFTSPALAPTVLPFLNGESGATSWAGAGRTGSMRPGAAGATRAAPSAPVAQRTFSVLTTGPGADLPTASFAEKYMR